jgi:hypothetical protein
MPLTHGWRKNPVFHVEERRSPWQVLPAQNHSGTDFDIEVAADDEGMPSARSLATQPTSSAEERDNILPNPRFYA